MSLEDNLGDIIRKARAMSGVSAASAAAAAGISEAQLAMIEASGIPKGEPDLIKLAGALGLSGRKLQGIARGWLPAERNPANWRELRCVTTDQGMAVNCYLAWDEAAREAALFDTGWSAKPVLDILLAENLHLDHIFITHSHEDHIACLAEIRAAWPKARMHTSAKNAPVEQRNRPGDFVHLGSLRVTHRDTPGHAEDGVTYVAGNWPDDAPHVAIVGDAIFAGSIGRGNISWDVARLKVREQIFTLPDDTLLCPGHGPLTTVGEEKANNPFFD